MAGSGSHKDKMPYHRFRAAADKCVKAGRCRKSGQIAEKIFQDPAADYTIIAQDNKGGQDAEKTDDTRPWVNPAVAGDGISPAVPPKAHFEHHDRQPQKDDKDQIGQQKEKAAVAAP